VTTPADWYLAAEARWAHLPAGEDREWRIKRTYGEIQAEAELVALHLPELTRDERSALLSEAVLEAHRLYGLPATDHAEELWDLRVDLIFDRLQVLAREQKADAGVRGKIIARRLARHWAPRGGAPIVQHSAAARAVADIIKTEECPIDRAEAERYALRRGLAGEAT
jgi:hypothetical protein